MAKWTKAQQKRNRAKWVKALRSGEYRQTKHTLTDGKGFCCLGVACEISKLGHWTDGVDNSEWVYAVGKAKDRSVLPKPVADWLGLTSEDGSYAHTCLASQNDNGMRFPAIAKIIESEPLHLFRS